MTQWLFILVCHVGHVQTSDAHTAVPRFSSRWDSLGFLHEISASMILWWFSGVFSPFFSFFSSLLLLERKKIFSFNLDKIILYIYVVIVIFGSSLLLEELLEGAPEASFVLFSTPLTEGWLTVLLRPDPPSGLVCPRLDPRVLGEFNTFTWIQVVLNYKGSQ